jgi:UDP-N-acetyl-D-glucosamine dehydrogenase
MKNKTNLASKVSSVSWEKELSEKIQRHQAKVAVIGLGYVGLPVLQEFCLEKFPSFGYDIDPAKITSLKKGENLPQHRNGRVDPPCFAITDFACQ